MKGLFVESMIKIKRIVFILQKQKEEKRLTIGGLA